MDQTRLFAALPYPLKVLAATARGFYLERWRYDGKTEERVAAALERESWSAERCKAWQEELLARLLFFAAREVPFYREAWSARRARGDRARVEELASWPVLEKEPLRRNPHAFVADSAGREKLFKESTSGSTGTPISLFWDREATRGWYALVEARCRRWHGLDREDRWAIVGGQPIAQARRRRPPFWVWNAAMNQLYLSGSHLSPELIPSYLEAMKKHRVRWLYGYSSALDSLSRWGEGHAKVGLEMVMSNAEPLYEHQRERIEKAFGCPARETYGMAELVAAASECGAGRLHQWPEVGVAELEQDDGAIVAQRPGASGNLIATGLLNFAQPLIRYRLGDRITFDDEIECACGRSLPRIAAIEGRSDDMVVTPDGRRLGRLDPIFKGGLPLHEAQVVQETENRLRLRLVPAADYGEETEAELRRRFRERVGEMELVIEKVEHLERGRNQKLRGVVSLMGNRVSLPESDLTPLPPSPQTERGENLIRGVNPSDSPFPSGEGKGAAPPFLGSPPSPVLGRGGQGGEGPIPKPLVSVILPVRNEESFIEKSLASLLSQSVGADRLEILLVDGMSEDKTRILASTMLSSHPNISRKVLDNPGRTAPCAMNIGLRAATGTYVARLDGHSELEPAYFEKAIVLLGQHPQAAGVAGRLETIGEGHKAAAIAAAMSSGFGVGGADFRLRGEPGSLVEADTVAFPVYRREALEENGYFDESLVRNQDDEYNFRLRKKGWKLLLAADLQILYYSRAAFRKLWSQYYEYGLFKVRVLQKHPRQMSPRHFVPFLFVLAIICSLALLPYSPLPLLLLAGAWGLGAAAASLLLAVREKWSLADSLCRLPLLPWAFFLLHAAYGTGFAAGLLRFGRFFGKTET
jgi:phenylacetate-CoA ligase